MPSDHPSVLLLVTDQQQARALGALDDSFSTPNLDAIAADGTLFERCYCTTPQCSPSRSTLITGQYPHQTGVYTLSNWGPYELDPDSPSIARAFRDAGYDTVWGGGRWDLGEGNIRDLGWDRVRNLDLTGSSGVEGLDCDERTVESCVDFLRRRSHDDPFFLTASLNLPHPPFFEDESFADRYDRGEVTLPESFADDLHDKPAFHRERANDDECRLGAEEYRDMRYRYRTMVSRVDDQIGRILDALREAGLYDELVIALTSDHGDMQGAHGLAKKGVLAYEELLRVPLIIRTPGREGPRRVRQLVSHVSLPATLLETAGLDPPDDFEGESFQPVLDGGSSPTNDAVFFEHKYAYWGHHPYRGVRTPDWKFVEYLAEDDRELYHLAEDPHEMTNLADESGYERVQTRLANLIGDNWETTNGDVDKWIHSPTP